MDAGRHPVDRPTGSLRDALIAEDAETGTKGATRHPDRPLAGLPRLRCVQSMTKPRLHRMSCGVCVLPTPRFRKGEGPCRTGPAASAPGVPPDCVRASDVLTVASARWVACFMARLSRSTLIYRRMRWRQLSCCCRAGCILFRVNGACGRLNVSYLHLGLGVLGGIISPSTLRGHLPSSRTL